MRQNRIEQIKSTQKAANINALFSIILLMIFLFLFIKSVKSQDKIIGFNGSGGLYGHRGNAYSINTDGSNYQINATFPYIPASPNDVVDGNDGYIYSVVGDGYYRPTYILKIKYDGSDYKEVKKFNQSTDGGSIRYRPVIGSDGFMYGVCETGGLNNTGTIWKIKLDGTMFSVIYHFPATTGIGQNYLGFYANIDYNGTNGSLTFGLDGKLYGVCGGGSYGAHIFRLNTNGTGFTALIHGTGYNNSPISGSGVVAPLVLGSDGNFYGCFPGGGLIDFAGGKGVAFRFNPISGTYNVIHYFATNGLEGSKPWGIAEGPGGYIYGVCYNLGIPNGIETDHGTLWKVAKDGSGFIVLKQFAAAETGTGVNYKIITGLNSKIYFSTRSWGLSASTGLGCLMSINPDGSAFRVIKNEFEGLSAPQSFFYRQDGGENTFYGLCTSTASYICKMDTSGKKFQPILGFDGYYKGSGSSTKPLYVNNLASPYYSKTFGLVGGSLTYASGNLFVYSNNTSINKLPDFVSYMRNYDANFRGFVSSSATPLLASDGNFYLAYTKVGPLTYSTDTQCIAKLNPSIGSQPTIIRKFYFITSSTPYNIGSNLLEGADGYIYGVMSSGGDNSRGAIFKMQKDGSNYSIIYQIPSGVYAPSKVIQDAATSKLIFSGNYGIFSLNTDGSGYTPISIPGVTNDGIVLQNDTIYGIQNYYSSFNIYKVHKNGTGYTILKNFTGISEGRYPNNELAIGNDGMIYGSCISGGTYDYGVLYKINKNGGDFSILKHFNYNSSTAGDGYGPGPVTFVPCSAPNNATNISFSGSTGNAITLSGFVAPETGAIGYVIKMNTTNAFSDMVDGVNPTASLVYGSGEQVIYNGTAIPTALTVTGLTANTTYYFKVYAYACNARFYSNQNTTGNPAQYRTQPNGIERVRGRMMHCNGVNQYANAGDVNAVEGLSALSFGGWMKPFAFPNTTLSQQSFICKGDGVNAATTSFFIKMYKDEVDLNVKLSAGISISGSMTPINLIIDSSLFKISQWSHVFVTWQSGEKMRLYINGKLVGQSLSTISGITNNVTGELRFGSSTATSEQTFNGDIEEVAIYQSQLNLCEIRQRMHNTLSGSENGLISYYQFNDATSSSNFIDVIGLHNATRVNAITNPISNLAVAGGNSFCDAVYSTNLNSTYTAFDLSNSLGLNFPSDVLNGDINISYLTENPVGGLPASGSNVINGYWIVNNFGTNTSNLNATVSLRFPNGIITDTTLSHYTLFKRGSVSYGAWTSYPITAISLATGNNAISITGIQDFSQFVLINTYAAPVPTVSIFTSNFNLCAGSSSTVIATATNGGSSPTYNFFVNGISVQNSTSNAYTSSSFHNADVVTCIVSNGITTATSNTIIYTVRTVPTVAVITGSTTNCTIGSSSNLSCATSGGSWSSYNPTIATVSSTGRVTAIANGNVIIAYSTTNTVGCTASSIITYNIAQVSPLPPITGTSSVCVGATVVLSNATVGGIWSSIAGRATVNNAGVVTGTSAGTATINYSLFNEFGCNQSTIYTVTVKPIPAVPTIQFAPGYPSPRIAGSATFCNNRTFGLVGVPSGGSWSSSNPSVLTINSSTGVANTVSIGSGSITYTTTSLGCSNSRSLAGVVANCPLARGINTQSSYDNESFYLYPNPAKSNISIQVNDIFNEGQIIITDILGKQLIKHNANTGLNNMSINSLNKGVYFVVVITDQKTLTKKLIIE
ncbi:MAG: choice-of-anchor tandem repeat GloVer-containing protein [Chitinophagaceae bacterium]